jgi:multiple sugar transport system substrate-binding protein
VRTSLVWFGLIPLTIAGAAALILSGCSAHKASDKVEIVYWTGWTGHELDELQGLVDEFNRSHPRIHVRMFCQFGQSGYQKVRIAFEGNATPDVMSTVWADELAAYAKRDLLEPLDGPMQKSHRSFDREFVPGLRKALRVDGKIYALAMTTGTSFIVYNKNVFRECGIKTPPKTPDELFEAARKTLKVRPDGTVDRFGFRPTGLFEWALVFGGKWYDPATRRITANDPRNVAALRWMASFNQILDANRSADFEASVGSDSTPSGPFFVGKRAMWSTGEWAEEFIKRYSVSLDYGFFSLPSPFPRYARTYYANGSAFVIPAACKHKAEAWEFLNWMTQPYAVRKFAVGIKNVPSLVSVTRDPYYQTDPLMMFAVNLANGPNASGPPGLAIWPYYNQEIQRAEDSAIRGGANPQVLLDKLQRKIEEQYRQVEVPLQ